MSAWHRRRCPHVRVRCIHGDELNDRGGRRRACLDCGRALDGDLPNPCTVTGKPHLSQLRAASQPESPTASATAEGQSEVSAQDGEL